MVAAVAEAVALLGAVQVEAIVTLTVFVSVSPQVLCRRAQKFVALVIAGDVIDAPVPTGVLVSGRTPRNQVTVTGVALLKETESVAVPPEVTCWL